MGHKFINTDYFYLVGRLFHIHRAFHFKAPNYAGLTVTVVGPPLQSVPGGGEFNVSVFGDKQSKGISGLVHGPNKVAPLLASAISKIHEQSLNPNTAASLTIKLTVVTPH
jgi:hypothetical protein